MTVRVELKAEQAKAAALQEQLAARDREAKVRARCSTGVRVCGCSTVRLCGAMLIV